MQYIKIKKKYRYIDVEWSSKDMTFLGYFLTSDVKSDIEWWIDWANSNFEAQGNLCWLEKKEDMVFIGFLYDESEDTYKDAFKISTSEFVNLLTKWHEFTSKNIPEFMIMFEDGKIEFQEIN